MILRGARVALGPEQTARLDLDIGGPDGRLDLEGYLILPGLLNAHDHLEFALFPRLGRGVYPNAGKWAQDIYRPQESPVREHLRVPKPVRVMWGGLRNLLSGVTTVCHHNPRAAVFDRNFPVRVVKRFGWAHSLDLSPDLAERFRETPEGWPFVVHLGEATDREGRGEILRLDRMGALDSRTVLVHAVALDRRGWRVVRDRGASVVWCPSSNLFTLGRTLDPAAIPAGVRLALGTDSALTAKGDLLDELRVARRVSGLPATALYRMVLEEPARILRLGSRRDLVAFRDRGRSPATALFGPPPELVIVGGRIKLASPSLAKHVRRRLFPLALEGRQEVLVDADVPMLYRQAARVLGPEIRLGGKPVLA